MQEVIREYLQGAKFGRKQVYKNMALFPLLSEYSLSLEHMLLDEALGAGLVEVTEVDNHGAVPNLKVHNKFILAAGNSTVVIPVSCVEQGRCWPVYALTTGSWQDWPVSDQKDDSQAAGIRNKLV
jgi:hypothetical protein